MSFNKENMEGLPEIKNGGLGMSLLLKVAEAEECTYMCVYIYIYVTGTEGLVI